MLPRPIQASCGAMVGGSGSDLNCSVRNAIVCERGALDLVKVSIQSVKG